MHIFKLFFTCFLLVSCSFSWWIFHQSIQSFNKYYNFCFLLCSRHSCRNWDYSSEADRQKSCLSCSVPCSAGAVLALGQILPAAYFVNRVLLKHSHAHLCLSILYDFFFSKRSWVVATENTWPTKVKIFSIGKVCQPMF